MKKLLFTIIAVVFATFSFSQQVSRHVVASGGNYSTASGISVSSTIGEPMVNTLTGTGFILTQGFQQPSITPSTIVIDSPLDGANFTTANSVTVSYTVNNFVVGFSAAGIDGHVHYHLNGAMTMVYNTNAIALNSLSRGGVAQFVPCITILT